MTSISILTAKKIEIEKITSEELRKDMVERQFYDECKKNGHLIFYARLIDFRNRNRQLTTQL